MKVVSEDTVRIRKMVRVERAKIKLAKAEAGEINRREVAKARIAKLRGELDALVEQDDVKVGGTDAD